MKKGQEPGPFIKLYVEEAAPILAKHFSNTRCLNGTRVCIDVLKHFNVRAKPLSVDVLVANLAYASRCMRGGLPKDDAELEEWKAAGAWAVGLDKLPSPDDDVRGVWPGHLVAIAQDWLIDSGSVQMSRPAKGIILPDIFVCPVSKRFLKGKDTLSFRDKDGTVIIYDKRDDKSFYRMPGFQAHDGNRAVADEVIERIERRMGRPPKKINPKNVSASGS
jgi:hypothetical protein